MTAPAEQSLNKRSAAVQAGRAGAVAADRSPSIVALVYIQFRGDFLTAEQLTMMSDRGRPVDGPRREGHLQRCRDRPGGRRSTRSPSDGKPKAKITLDVDPQVHQPDPGRTSTPRSRRPRCSATSTSPSRRRQNPSPQRITASDVIDASSVTTEFNTLFETVTSMSEKVDPIKLNQTLTATAQALRRARRPVRPVDRQRQRDPRRPQPADAAAPPATTSGWPIWPTCTPTPRPTCSTA